MRQPVYKVLVFVALTLAAMLVMAQTTTTSAAMLYPTGTVYVNGVIVTTPTAVYAGDVITFGSGGSGTITDKSTGKSVSLSGSSYTFDGTTSKALTGKQSCTPFIRPNGKPCPHSTTSSNPKACGPPSQVPPSNCNPS